jgi:hypothetical protein
MAQKDKVYDNPGLPLQFLFSHPTIIAWQTAA